MNRVTKSLLTVAIGVAHGIWWLFPSDTTSLIAEEQPVLLGRYSEGRFYAMVLAALLSGVGVWVARGGPRRRRERAFKVAAASLGILVGLVVLDLGVRALRTPRYVDTRDAFHRQPNQRATLVFRDLPKGKRSSPAPPGHPDVPYVLTTDERGFRNRTRLDRYDVVVLGDSFVEGSKVSDEQTWPSVYSRLSGRSVYNLGVSGAEPRAYARNLRTFGTGLSPGLVMCMIYEGNDFGGGVEATGRLEGNGSLARRVAVFLESSPVRLAIHRSLTRYLSFAGPGAALPAPTNAEEGAGNGGGIEPRPATPSAAADAFAWLPIRIPYGEAGHYYHLNVRRVAAHWDGPERLARSQGLREVESTLLELKEICAGIGARLLVVFAPDKPHAVLPLVEDRVGAEQIAALLALRREDLPPAERAKAILFANLAAREAAVRAICAREAIDFVAVTGALRRAIAGGAQTYYTYDQHWSPSGHEVVAATVHEYLEGDGT